MIPHYFLTNTFYGNWLPRDPRGFITSVRDQREGEEYSTKRREHDQFGTPYDKQFTGLYFAAKQAMKGEVITLTLEHAEVLFKQLHETTMYRHWPMLALAIMADHLHIVIQVTDNSKADKVLADLKAWGSRALNKQFGEPASETWWTSKGSKRPKFDEASLRNAILYILKQENPLILWACDAVKNEYAEHIPAYCR